MNKKYISAFMSTVLVVATIAVSCAQNQKVKTVTIVNGDTTISETNLNDKDIAKMEKEINVSINDDGTGTKKIVKKIIITDDKVGGEGMAYAYAMGDEGDDVEVTTNDNGTETKIVIKKGDGKEGKGDKEGKKVVRKEVRNDGASPEEGNMRVNFSIDKTTAKLEVETKSKEPLNISILDENGKQVFYDTQKTGRKYSKDIPLGKKGTFFLNLIQNKTSTMEKIIVE